MADNIRLPKRVRLPKSELSDWQMVFLDTYILGIGDTKQMFRALLAMSKSEKEVMNMLKALLGNSDAIVYIEERTRQIRSFFGGSRQVSDGVEALNQDDVRKVIIDNVSQDIIASLRDGTLDYKQGSIVEKFITKVLDYDEKEEAKPEPPRIYLPESCSSCRIRKAFENPDIVEDECQSCRYRMDSLERGVEYDNKNQFIEENEI